MNLQPTSIITKLSSPLRASTEPLLPIGFTPTRKKLFDDKPTTLDFLSKLYGINFLSPRENEHAEEFFLLTDQIQKIEEKLKLTITQKALPEYRNRVRQLLKSKDDFSTKMSELGMFLFYLDNNKCPLEKESLITARSLELQEEVESYLESHQEISSPTVPSGKTHYLIRAFAHMVLTIDQVYNPGGLFCIDVLLRNAQYQIAKYLQPEHRDHILTIVNEILVKSQFIPLFARKITVHPDLEIAIRLDLKLPPHAKVESVHALYDCIMALFSDVRQLVTPNCYAVSSLIYASENYTYKTLSKLIEWIEKGHYVFNDTTAIPLLPLLERRLVNPEDLSVQLTNLEANQLVTIGHIFKTLSIETFENRSAVKIPLRKSMSDACIFFEDDDILPFAEKMYCAYKHNTLVHLQLAIIEWVYMNSGNPYSPDKMQVIQHIMNAISTGLAGRHSHPIFKNSVQKVLGERLWLQNCSQREISFKNNRVTLEGRKFTFQGNQDQLKKLFQSSLRIFCREEKSYTLLSRITDLQDAATRVVEEVERKKIPGDVHRNFIIAVRSNKFRQTISKAMAEQIKTKGIQGKHLNGADLYIYKQTGGAEYVVLDLVYGISVSKKPISHCETPYTFVKNLLRALNECGLGHLFRYKKLLISTPGHHVWTLSPKKWYDVFNRVTNFDQFIQTMVFNRAHHKLKSIAPLEFIHSVINKFAGSDDYTRNEMLEFFDKRFLVSYKGFIDYLKSYINVQDSNMIAQILDEEMYQAALTKQSFSRILRALRLDVSTPVYHELYDKIGNDLLPLNELITKIRHTLIEQGLAVIDPYKIELALCKVLCFPLPISVGDLNWTDEYREDPHHTHLMIKYSWFRNTLCFFIRESNGDLYESKENYSWFQIQFPQSAPNRYFY